MQLTIKARLMACLAALAVGMVAIGLSGWISNTVAGKRIQSIIVDRVEPMQHLKAVSDMYAVNIVDSAHKAQSGALAMPQALDRVKVAKAAITSHWSAYAATDMTPEERALEDKAQAALPQADKAVSELEGILASGDAAALSDFTAHRLYPAIDPVTANVSALVDLQTTVAHRDGEQAAHAAKIAMMAMGAIALAAAGALAFATNIIIAKVSTPLQAMTRAMQGLADGDNTVAIPALGQHDELARWPARSRCSRRRRSPRSRPTPTWSRPRPAPSASAWPPASPPSPSSRPWWSARSARAWPSWPKAT